jgi:uncharacterized protein YbcI
VTEQVSTVPEDALREEITDALVAIWIHYAGKSPADARTDIRDNVVTCVLIDAVSDYDSALGKRSASSSASGLSDASYKSEAAAKVAELMGRPVTSLISSHDLDTNAATETFTLERRLFS